MATFQVTPGDLLSLASVLRTLTQELSEAGGMTPGCGGVENQNVESHLNSFFSNWSEGLGKIETNLSQLEQRLSAAGSGYDGTDNSIANALTPH